jgi:hypothetical protein
MYIFFKSHLTILLRMRIVFDYHSKCYHICKDCQKNKTQSDPKFGIEKKSLFGSRFYFIHFCNWYLHQCNCELLSQHYQDRTDKTAHTFGCTVCLHREIQTQNFMSTKQGCPPQHSNIHCTPIVVEDGYALVGTNKMYQYLRLDHSYACRQLSLCRAVRCRCAAPWAGHCQQGKECAAHTCPQTLQHSHLV